MKQVQLHVAHDLGGGIAKWLSDYCAADRERRNLVLRPLASDAAMARGVALYDGPATEAPLKSWAFSRPIAAAAVAHAEYRAALREAIEGWGVQGLIVSSLIGHSLEVLETQLPTLVVCHDYFPWCPAINLYYDGVCARCDGGRIADCHANNPEYNPFAGFDAPERVAVRERFVELARRANLRFVAPSDSVGRNLHALEPRLREVPVTTIAHGYSPALPRVPMGALTAGDRLRVLVLGQLSKAKGQKLLEAALPRLANFADLYLLGCGEVGELFKFDARLQVIQRYEVSELPGHVAAIRPHLGLLMSVVSESFSYTLSELSMLGVPCLATEVGSFTDRIHHGENGFLFKPDVSSMVEALRALDADRAALARVRAHLESYRHRSTQEMVADYHRAMPLEPPVSAKEPSVTPEEKSAAVEAATVAGMWKHVRKLDLELALVNDARQRLEMHRLADAEARRVLEGRVQHYARGIAEREEALLRKEIQVQDLSNQLRTALNKIEELFGSTSWRVSAPVRLVGNAMPGVRLTLKLLSACIAQPSTARYRIGTARKAWREEGWEGVRRTLAGEQAAGAQQGTWLDYRARLERDVLPYVVARVPTLARQPLISIVVPVFNPDMDMFRQMLESVRKQAYPYWELCLADDGSTEAHVREIMQEYTRADRRIKTSFATRNGGIAVASNRALSMATGEFVVLADHDDVIEEQALFRFAEAIVEDDPDVAYSDEVLVTHDRNSVMRYSYRPAFSPEYLRSHPYIVHMVGFRAELLREIGGWDETLRISQDYDLILRATERAKRVVHIPELLYRWRIHGKSTGIASQGQVMEVSKSVLRRHLERIGEKGDATDGPSFNLFETRYELQPGLKVAIVIPTKNHGDLLRQCIESIHANAGGAHYDIVVVDHESDDAATLAYLGSIRSQVQVLRYAGPFNFSAINNWAVQQLGGGYTHYLLCNNDIEAFERGWLERMLELGQHADVGIVGAMLFYADRKTIQHAGVGVGLFGAAEHYGKNARYPEGPVEAGFAELFSLTHEVSAVTAACMLVGADAWREVGGFDEQIAVGFGDVDFCLRVGAAGFRVVFNPHARLVHHESITRGISEHDPHPTDSSLYRMKWKGLMDAGDPYYSPGLETNSYKWEFRTPIPVHRDVRRRVWTRGQDDRQRVTIGPQQAG
jgi:GT2 family glycosyltransferase/glycosyltransferase involved in cell wall biosynthesis